MCCGVVPILFGWFLRVPSLHALVFIWKPFCDFNTFLLSLNFLSGVQVCHQNPMGSHCTMGQVGLSMGAHCLLYPTVRTIPLYHGTGGTVHVGPLSHLRAPYPTFCPIPLYHGTGGTVHGSPLSHLRAPHPSVHPIPLYHGTGGTVYGNPLSHLRAPYPSVCPIPLYHGTGGTVYGSPLSYLRAPYHGVR